MDKQGDNLEAPIVIVDDDREFRRLISSILSCAGYRVLEAESARSADAILSEHKVSLLIVDQNMPGTDGTTFISGIRHAGIQVPIVYLSAQFADQQAFKRLVDELHVNLVLQKPVVPELFLCQIEFLLAGKRGGRATETPLPVADGDVLRKLFEHKDDHEPLTLIDRKPLLAPRVPVSTDKKVKRSKEKLSHAKRAAKDRDSEIMALTARLHERPDKDEISVLSEPEPDILEELKLFREKLEIERLVHEARLDYAKELPETIEALIRDIAEMRKRPSSDALYEQVLAQAHKFRGTAGSMGFFQLGKAAGVLEDLLLSMQRSGNAVSETAWDEIVEALNNCERNCESHVVDWSGSYSVGNQSGKSRAGAGESGELKILIVDDDQVLMRFVGGVLSGEGFVVEQLNEPVRVVQTALKFHPDLVLLDVVMPGLSGYDIARALRSEESLSNTSIVFLTARMSAAAKKAAMRAGGDDFLAKPIFAEELKAKVRSVLHC